LGFSCVCVFGGHVMGEAFHEASQFPNFVDA